MSALPGDERRRLIGHSSNIYTSAGRVLYDYGDPLDYVYFPDGAVLSLLAGVEEGETNAVAVVGDVGVVGADIVMGARASAGWAVAHVPGRVLRVRAETVREEFSRGGTLRDLLLGYVRALLVQAIQTVACTRHHVLDRRFCRWLLTLHDQAGADEFMLTHEAISLILGVRREAVTLAIRRLQACGLISHGRGNIGIVDRRRLEAYACECYGLIRKAYDFLPGAGSVTHACPTPIGFVTRPTPKAAAQH